MKSVSRIDDQIKKNLNLNDENMDLQNQIYQVKLGFIYKFFGKGLNICFYIILG